MLQKPLRTKDLMYCCASLRGPVHTKEPLLKADYGKKDACEGEEASGHQERRARS